MASGHRILVAEDEPEVRNYLGIALQCQGYQVDFAETGEEVLNHLATNKDQVSLVLMDIMMPRKDGIETLRQLRQIGSSPPVIMVSGASSPWHIVESMRNGAADFLPKPVSHDDLAQSIAKAIGEAPARTVESAADPIQNSDELVVRSGWSDRIETWIKQVAASDVPVLLQGETGVGKEVLAHKLHARSRRAAKTFLKLNCAALPSELVESELFGYERGAFTGALKNNPGKFEMANGGTILLDEIGDMDLKLQAKLLQVLQDKEFLRLGAREVCRVDVRVMAATHRDLECAVAAGLFREDLYYRLNIIPIQIPPLRERRDEIIPLAIHFLRKYADSPAPELPRHLRNALVAHNWPGNIRELENVVRKYLVLGDADLIIRELGLRASRVSAPKSQPDAGRPAVEVEAPSLEPANTAKDETETPASALPFDDFAAGESHSILGKVDAARRQAESQAILNALTSCLWNRKEAAALLKVDYKALLYKMKKLGIGDKAARAGA